LSSGVGLSLYYLAACGWCGATLEVRSPPRARGRRFVCACTAYHRKGTSVCANQVQLPLALADAALLAALRDKLRQVEQEMARLLALAKMAGPSKLLADEFRTLERRRAQLEQATQQAVVLPPAVDLDRLRALLAEWRERIHREMPIARQMLRVLFPERIRFSPDAEQQTVELRADCAVGRVFERLLVPQTVMAPTGFESHDNHLPVTTRVLSPSSLDAIGRE